MGVLQVANINFESTGNTQIRHAGSNTVQITAGGSNTFVANSTTVQLSGTTVAANSSTLAVGSNVIIGTATVFVGNATVNVTINSTSLGINGALIANSTGANNAFYLGGTVASSYQLNSTLNANIASYLPTYTGTVNAASVNVGANVIANATGVYVGNATVNSAVSATSITVGANIVANATGVYVGNATVNSVANSSGFYNNGTVVGASFASGTVMLFQQTAAPTGWTKKTCYHDVGIRIVNATASAVTNQSAFTTVFGTCKSTGATTLSTPQIPSHTHGLTLWRADYCNACRTGTGGPVAGGSSSTGSAGGGGSHTHTMTLNLNYVDMILASKN